MYKKLPRKERWSYWRDKCDTIFSELVKIRGNWKCIETGAKDELQAAHIVSREYKNTRWDFDNAVVLRSGRHIWYTNHPIEWKLFINKTFGDGYYEAMEHRALIIKKWSTQDLKDLYVELKGLGSAGSK